MKYRVLIALLTLLVLGGVAFYEANSTPEQPTQQAPSDGIVLH